MRFQQVIQQAHNLEFNNRLIKELRYINKKSHGAVEVDKNYLNANIKVKRPRYRLTIKNKLTDNQIEKIKGLAGYIDFGNYTKDESTFYDFSYYKNPTLNEILLEVIELKKLKVYIKLELTDWNEISDEAWEVFLYDYNTEKDELWQTVKDQADEILFNYHVTAIIDSDEKIIRAITDEEQLKDLYNMHEQPKSQHIIKIQMQNNEEIPEIIKKNMELIRKDLRLFNSTIRITKKKILVTHNGLYLKLGQIFAESLLKKKLLDEEIIEFISKNISIQSKFNNPFEGINLTYDKKDFIKDMNFILN